MRVKVSINYVTAPNGWGLTKTTISIHKVDLPGTGGRQGVGTGSAHKSGSAHGRGQLTGGGQLTGAGSSREGSAHGRGSAHVSSNRADGEGEGTRTRQLALLTSPI